MNSLKKSDVSVAIPFLNRSSFLKRALDSISNQTYQVEKVYIVDNGSKYDEILEVLKIIKSHALSTCCVLVSSLNRFNANYARNLAMDLCCTKYLAFLDSDDWWLDQHLERSVKLLKDSDKVGVYSGRYEKLPFENRLNKSVDISICGNPFNFFWGGKAGTAQSSSFVIEVAPVIESFVYWDTSLKRNQDIDFFITLELNTKGWIFQGVPEYYIDWCEGGTKGKIDANAIFYFYKKWQAYFSRSIVDRYFLRYLVVFVTRGMYKEFFELQSEYRSLTISLKNYVKSSFLACLSFSLLLKVKSVFRF